MTTRERFVLVSTEFLLRTVLRVPILGSLLQIAVINPFFWWSFNGCVAYLEKELGKGKKLYKRD